MFGEIRRKANTAQCFLAWLTGRLASARRSLAFPARVSALRPNDKKARSIRDLEGALEQIADSFKRVETYSNALADFLPCGLIACDSEGSFTAFNRTAQRLLRAEGADFPRWNILRGEIPSGSPELARILEMMRDVLLTGREYSGEEVGHSPRLAVTANPMRNFRSELQGVVVTITDVTEARRLRNLLYSVERLASFGEMAAGITHEIKNPLTSVRGLAQVIELGTLSPDKQRGYARTIIAEMERLESILTRLLDWARPAPAESSPTRMETIIEEMLLLVGASARLAGIKITHDVEGEPGTVLLDPKAMKQALLNIVINAIQATPGGGAIRIVTRREGDRIRVDIRDTGPGIDKDILPHIFEPFFTTREKGTGLGLSIAQEIVRDHGGEIRVESRPGEGTCFTVFLPVRTPAGGSPGPL